MAYTPIHTLGGLGQPYSAVEFMGVPETSYGKGYLTAFEESLAKSPLVVAGNWLKQKYIENFNAGEILSSDQIKQEFPKVANQYPNGGSRHLVQFSDNKLNDEIYRQEVISRLPDGFASSATKYAGFIVANAISPTNIILLLITIVIIKKVIKIVKPFLHKDKKNTYTQVNTQSHKTVKEALKMKKHCLIFGNLFIWIFALLNCLIYGQEIYRGISGNYISLGAFIFLLSENIFLFIFMNYLLMDKSNNKNFWRSLFDKSELTNNYYNFMKFSKAERIVFVSNIIYCLLSILLLILHLSTADWEPSNWSWYVKNVTWIFKAQLFMVSATCLMGYAHKYFIDGKDRKLE